MKFQICDRIYGVTTLRKCFFFFNFINMTFLQARKPSFLAKTPSKKKRTRQKKKKNLVEISIFDQNPRFTRLKKG